jgi:hypothetical protein
VNRDDALTRDLVEVKARRRDGPSRSPDWEPSLPVGPRRPRQTVGDLMARGWGRSFHWLADARRCLAVEVARLTRGDSPPLVASTRAWFSRAGVQRRHRDRKVSGHLRHRRGTAPSALAWEAADESARLRAAQCARRRGCTSITPISGDVPPLRNRVRVNLPPSRHSHLDVVFPAPRAATWFGPGSVHHRAVTFTVREGSGLELGRPVERILERAISPNSCPRAFEGRIGKRARASESRLPSRLGATERLPDLDGGGHAAGAERPSMPSPRAARALGRENERRC